MKKNQIFPKLNRRYLVFIFCIIISAFFWLILTLNKNYTSTVAYPILFNNVPNGKLILNTLPETVELEISTNGFSMLFLKLKRRLTPLEINFLTFKNSNKQEYYHIILKHEINKIDSLLGPKVNVIRLLTDTVHLHLAKIISKTVPIKSAFNYHLPNNFQLADSIIFEPSNIKLTGADIALSNINFIETESYNFGEIKTSTEKIIQLKLPNESLKIRSSINKVQVRIKLKKLYLENVVIPIHIKNIPKGIILRPIQNQVKIYFKVPIENKDSINETSFKINIDYSKHEMNKIKVELIKKPKYVSLYEIQPSEIEFCIQNK